MFQSSHKNILPQNGDFYYTLADGIVSSRYLTKDGLLGDELSWLENPYLKLFLPSFQVQFNLSFDNEYKTVILIILMEDYLPWGKNFFLHLECYRIDEVLTEKLERLELLQYFSVVLSEDLFLQIFV